MIELAAAAWKMDPFDAARRLDAIPGRTPHAGQDFPAYATQRARAAGLAAFWEECVQRLRKTTRLPRDIQNLTRKSFGDSSPQLDRVDQPLGIASKEQLRDFGEAFHLRMPGQAAAYLVQAAYDLPGRICGFWLYSHRTADPKGIFVPCVQDAAELCYTMRTTVFEATKEVPGDLMLMLNPWWAVMLQMRHMKSSLAPLPLLGINLPRHAIHHTHNHLGNRRRIIITDGPASDLHITVLIKLLLAARGLNASIGHMQKFANAKLELHQKRPVDWLHYVCQTAQSWRGVLEGVLGRLGIEEVSALLKSMPLQPDEAKQLLSACSPIVQVAVSEAGKAVTARFRDALIVQSEHGWIMHTGNQVCNARVRIEEIIKTDEQATYRGKLIFGTQELPFAWTGAAGDHLGFNRQLRNVAAQADKAFVIRADFAQGIFDIAKQLHAPLIRKGIDRIGWVPSQGSFRFPRFSIDNVGRVLAGGDTVYVGAADVADIPPPSFLSGAELRALDSPTLPLALAILAGTMQAAIASAVRLTKPRMLFASNGVHETTSILVDALQCRRVRLCLQDRAERNTEYNQAQHHEWPSFLVPGDCIPSRLGSWVLRGGLNTFACGTRLQGIALATRGWTIVNDAVTPPDAAFLQAYRALPACYFQDVASRRFDMQREPTSFDTILVDLLVWLKRIGGPPLPLETIPVTARGCYPQALYDLATENPLRKLGVKKTDQQVRVPKHLLWNTIRRDTGIDIDAAAITASLRSAGAILETHTTDAAWVLPLDWWDSRPT
jgi:hypothetical protein